MPLERRVVERGLKDKGFRLVQGHHAFFIYYSEAGKKSTVRTKTSHGSSHKDIADGLVSQMARQCKLSNQQFRELVGCGLSRAEYEAKLLEVGLIDPPAGLDSSMRH